MYKCFHKRVQFFFDSRCILTQTVDAVDGDRSTGVTRRDATTALRMSLSFRKALHLARSSETITTTHRERTEVHEKR